MDNKSDNYDWLKECITQDGVNDIYVERIGLNRDTREYRILLNGCPMIGVVNENDSFCLSIYDTVLDSELRVKWGASQGWAGNNMRAYHIYQNQSWTEESITWNNQTCGVNITSSVSCKFPTIPLKTFLCLPNKENSGPELSSSPLTKNDSTGN